MNDVRKATISVLVPTMNRPQALDRTLKSFTSGSCIPSQIVVVDQSNDERLRAEVASIVEKYRSQTSVELISQKGSSLTKARNLAVSYARNEILVFSDDDVDVNIDTIENVEKIFCDPQIVMLGGLNSRQYTRVLNRREKIIRTCAKLIRRRKGGWVSYAMLGRYQEGQITKPVSTQWAMGYFFVVRKSLIDRWNIRWDEKLIGYAYAEDLDFSYSYYKEAKKEGLKCILHPDVVVAHLGSQEYRTPNKLATLFFIVNRAYLARKHRLGIRGKLATDLWNWYVFFSRTFLRKNAVDVLKAMRYLSRHKEDVYKGNLYTSADFKKFI